MPTRSTKTVEKKTTTARTAATKAPAGKVVRAPAKKAAAPKSTAEKGAAEKAEKKTTAATKSASAARAPAKTATRTAAAKAPAAKAAAAAKPAPKKPRAPAWTERPVPIHELEGKASDPRLAAALAARERWHGRSGRPALKSSTQAVAFARERLLVHPRTRSALPNLIDPIVGHVCSEEERVTGPIAQTLKSWSREIYNTPDLLEARLCFERPTLIKSDLWPALVAVASPLEAAARAGGLLSEEAEEALDILDRKGVIPTERLRQLLGLNEEEFTRVHAELESRLVVLSRGGLDEDDNPITLVETLGRWADRVAVRRDLEVGRAWTLLFLAALRSAVVLWPEEIEALFPWTPEERKAAIEEALTTGSLISYVEDGSTAWVASPVPR